MWIGVGRWAWGCGNKWGSVFDRSNKRFSLEFAIQYKTLGIKTYSCHFLPILLHLYLYIKRKSIIWFSYFPKKYFWEVLDTLKLELARNLKLVLKKLKLHINYKVWLSTRVSSISRLKCLEFFMRSFLINKILSWYKVWKGFSCFSVSAKKKSFLTLSSS